MDEVVMMPLAVVIASILDSRDPATRLEFHVVGLGLSRSSKRELEAMVADRAAVVWHDLNWKVRLRLERIYAASQASFPPVIYARLLLGQLLPSRIQRAIYLDADVLVRADLTPLWTMDLEGAVIGAALDLTPHRGHQERIASLLRDEDRTRFGFESTNPYFNSGVLLIDVAAMRGAIEDDLLGVMARYPGLYYPDQDALNIVLGQRCHFVDNRWKQTGATFREAAEEQSGLPSEAFRCLREEPWIVHFTSRPEPWRAGCSHPVQPAWEKASAQTHGVRRRPLWNWVLRAFRRLRRDGYSIASRSRQRQV